MNLPKREVGKDKGSKVFNICTLITVDLKNECTMNCGN
jgi:hypothetical protein